MQAEDCNFLASSRFHSENATTVLWNWALFLFILISVIVLARLRIFSMLNSPKTSDMFWIDRFRTDRRMVPNRSTPSGQAYNVKIHSVTFFALKLHVWTGCLAGILNLWILLTPFLGKITRPYLLVMSHSELLRE